MLLKRREIIRINEGEAVMRKLKAIALQLYSPALIGPYSIRVWISVIFFLFNEDLNLSTYLP
jgi:hypothetical protein